MSDLKARGNKAFAAGNYVEAESLYAQAIEASPENHVRSWAMRRRVRRRVRRLVLLPLHAQPLTFVLTTLSPPSCRAPVSSPPALQLLYANRSGARFKQDNFEGALADADKTIALQPAWIKGYHRRAIALQGLGQKDAVIESYVAALKFEPDNKWLKAQLRQARVAGGKAVSVEQDKLMMVESAIESLSQDQQRQMMEVQARMQEVNRKLSQTRAGLEANHREQARTRITRSQLEKMPADAPRFISVGRMFMRASTDDVDSSMNAESAGLVEKAKSLKGQFEYLTKQQAALQKEMAEVMMKRR